VLLHCDRRDPAAERWLREQTKGSVLGREILLGAVAQTRVELTDDEQLFVALQSAPTAGAELETMRLWLTPRWFVSVLDRVLPAVSELDQALEAGRGPKSPIEVLISVARASNQRAERSVLAMEEELADIEYRGGEVPRRTFDRLRALHQTAAGFRRGKLREREALTRIAAHPPAWLAETQPGIWAELARNADDVLSLLDGVIERSRSLYDYVQGDLASILNDRLYILTLISAIVLPLSFITGLLGVNVGGIPLRETSWAFEALCVFLAVLAVGQFFLARRLQWIPPRKPRERRWRWRRRATPPVTLPMVQHPST
jgi:zinc transporter